MSVYGTIYDDDEIAVAENLMDHTLRLRLAARRYRIEGTGDGSLELHLPLGVWARVRPQTSHSERYLGMSDAEIEAEAREYARREGPGLLNESEEERVQHYVKGARRVRDEQPDLTFEW